MKEAVEKCKSAKVQMRDRGRDRGRDEEAVEKWKGAKVQIRGMGRGRVGGWELALGRGTRLMEVWT